MMSLAPRYDLFRFKLPHDFLPEEIKTKWEKILKQDPGVFDDPLEYLNESIIGINIPGISDVNIQQPQHSYNVIKRSNVTKSTPGKINVEPKQDNTYVSPANPLDLIERSLTVNFRLNQGFYNYFMLYETLFYVICKPILYGEGRDFFIDLMDETGTARSRIYLMQCLMDGIDGLDFSYDKVDRQTDTFSVTWKFNNIDYNVLEVPQT